MESVVAPIRVDILPPTPKRAAKSKMKGATPLSPLTPHGNLDYEVTCHAHHPHPNHHHRCDLIQSLSTGGPTATGGSAVLPALVALAVAVQR